MALIKGDICNIHQPDYKLKLQDTINDRITVNCIGRGNFVFRPERSPYLTPSRFSCETMFRKDSESSEAIIWMFVELQGVFITKHFETNSSFSIYLLDRIQ